MYLIEYPILNLLGYWDLIERDKTTNAPSTAFVEFSTWKAAWEARKSIFYTPKPGCKGSFLELNATWAKDNLDRTAKG